MNWVEEDGGAEALVLVVGDGWVADASGGEAVVAQGDGFFAKVAWCFVA